MDEFFGLPRIIESGGIPREVSDRIDGLGQNIEALAAEHAELAQVAGVTVEHVSRIAVFNGYLPVLIAAFLVTLIATPVMRHLALANGIVDMPTDPRKVHRRPTAYLGGAAVFLGLMAGVFVSYLALKLDWIIDFHPTMPEHMADAMHPDPVPISIVLGLTVIMLVGLLDDVFGVNPWRKVGGQLFAAAALASQNVGVKVAAGVILPVAEALHIPLITTPEGVQTLGFMFELPFEMPMIGTTLTVDAVYWIGTATIAMFVMGGCNASNLIDGLDGLLSGVTAIAAFGLLVVALTLAVLDDGPRDAQRVVLCLALLGACLGFLPHNFNPATIFLGDCGSLLLGFTTIVVILTLGDTGKTHLVFAGLFIYAIPIIDTALAIIRRKLAGKSIADADDQHLHHMLKRGLGGVKQAVFALYGIGATFALIGVAMSLGRARISYAFALLFAAYVGVIAIKSARKSALDEQAHDLVQRRIARQDDGSPPPPAAPQAQPAAGPSEQA